MYNAHYSIQCFEVCVHMYYVSSGATRLLKAEWGSGPREGEGHGGCYDNLIMLFEK